MVWSRAGRAVTRAVSIAVITIVASISAASGQRGELDLPPLPSLGVPPFAQPGPGYECDLLAAGDVDAGSAVRPVSRGEIKPDLAVPACESALKNDPHNARFAYQLGRALEQRRDDVAARAAYSEAAEQGHVQATLALARLLRLGRGGPHDPDASFRLVSIAALTGHPEALLALALHHRGGIGTPHDLDQWFALVMRAAESGSSAALRQLGEAYADGLGVPRNRNIAEDLFLSVVEQERPRADAGHADAIWMMGDAYERGAGVPTDPKIALEWYRRGEALGDLEAIASIGDLFARGLGVDADAALACNYYERASVDGNARVLGLLGACYATGKGRGRDVMRGLSLLERASAAGDGAAAHAIGRRYEDGDGVEQSRARALAYYRKSAERGYAQGMIDYGFSIRGTGPDGARLACDWYERAAKSGFARGMNNLGSCYGNDEGGRPKDLAMALGWYERAAELGDGLALRNLGDLHLKGIGVAQNETRALAFYRRGAEAGDVGAMVEAGMMLTRGLGGAANPAGGCDWFQKAAERGNARAMNNVGACFANGEGRPFDVVAGIAWYQRAVDAGDAVAMANLGDHYANGRGVARDPARAAKLFKASADKGYAGGAVEYALSLYNGSGVERDPVGACSWYEKAAAQNHPAGHNGHGVCLEYGIGRKPDVKAALAAFTRGAEAGNATAMRNLVRFADRGLIGRRDPDTAARWLRRAVELGNEPFLIDVLSYPTGWSRDTRRALQQGMKRDGMFNGPIDGFLSATFDTALWNRLPDSRTRLQQSFTWAPAEGTARGLLVRVCTSRDGGGARRPLVVINHGLTTDEAERRDMRPLACGQIARFFVDRGFTVAIPLRRGYGETGGRFAEGGTRVCATSPDFVGPGLAIASDIQATITHMVSRRDIAPAGTVVIGHSGGGWGTLALASRNAPGIAGLVNISGVHGSNRNKPDGVCGPEPITKSTRTFGRTARQPTLWIYAENDSHAGPRLVRRMIEGYRREGGEATLLSLPPIDTDGHNIFDDDSLDLWSQPLGEWLAKLKK